MQNLLYMVIKLKYAYEYLKLTVYFKSIKSLDELQTSINTFEERKRGKYILYIAPGKSFLENYDYDR